MRGPGRGEESQTRSRLARLILASVEKIWEAGVTVSERGEDSW